MPPSGLSATAAVFDHRRLQRVSPACADVAALIRVHCHGSQGATINTIVTLPGGAPWSPLCCMSHAAASTVPRGLGPK